MTTLNFQDFLDGGRIAAGGIKDFATGLVNPTLRLGVTGLSRSGKTVFITALVHALLKGARLPVFDAYAKGRITRCYLEPQPDDDLPRFPYELNLEKLTGENRHWPEGTSRISQLRLTIEYEPQGLDRPQSAWRKTASRYHRLSRRVVARFATDGPDICSMVRIDNRSCAQTATPTTCNILARTCGPTPGN